LAVRTVAARASAERDFARRRGEGAKVRWRRRTRESTGAALLAAAAGGVSSMNVTRSATGASIAPPLTASGAEAMPPSGSNWYIVAPAIGLPRLMRTPWSGTARSRRAARLSAAFARAPVS
jgi:hypothetical protein